MFNSIATLFSVPSHNRNYPTKPSLVNYSQKTKQVAYGRHENFIDKQVADILQNLHEPVQNWIIQKQPYLRCHALNSAIFRLIISHSKKGNTNTTETCKVTVHNLFVLVVQYKILNERIKQTTTEQLQLIIDGVSGIYLKEEKSPFDELTCLMHFVVSNCPLHEVQLSQGSPCLWRPIELTHLSNLFAVYKNLPDKYEGNFIDMVVNVIPLLAELFKIIMKTDPSPERYKILQNFPWIRSIGCRMLRSICGDIDRILSETNSHEQSPIDYSQQQQNPVLRKRLFERSQQLLQVEGFVSSKALFTFAIKELYYFQHVLRLHKHMMELSNDNQQLSHLQQLSSFQLIQLLFSAASKYDVNLPDVMLQFLSSILSIALQGGFHLIIPHLKSASVQTFVKTAEQMPRYQWNSPERQFPSSDSAQFYLQKDTSILYYLLEMLFNLKLQYLEVLHTFMQKSDPAYQEHLQFYLIKNGLMHFLIEELQALKGNDKRHTVNYFKIIAMLLKGNRFAYCVFDQILTGDLDQMYKGMFVQYVRKNFYYAKQFLLVLTADTITINVSQQHPYFLPVALQLLLYPDQNSESKHDVWISYIHDVIIRELRHKMEKERPGKEAPIEKELNEWVTLAIMLQVECMASQSGSELELGKFTMKYLTTILTEAIKWKHGETEVMRRLSQTYEEWEVYYTQTILDRQDNEDVIATKLGPVLNFLYLRKWNRQICKTIKLFIESVVTTVLPKNLFA